MVKIFLVHAMFPENFKAIGPGVQELSSGNSELLKYTTKCQFSKKMASGGPSWILENAEKTIAHNGKVPAMFPENFKAIGQAGFPPKIRNKFPWLFPVHTKSGQIRNNFVYYRSTCDVKCALSLHNCIRKIDEEFRRVVIFSTVWINLLAGANSMKLTYYLFSIGMPN